MAKSKTDTQRQTQAEPKALPSLRNVSLVDLTFTWNLGKEAVVLKRGTTVSLGDLPSQFIARPDVLRLLRKKSLVVVEL